MTDRVHKVELSDQELKWIIEGLGKLFERPLQNDTNDEIGNKQWHLANRLDEHVKGIWCHKHSCQGVEETYY
mgnify:CR=1 FL=1